MFILFAPGQLPDRVLQAEIGGKLAQGTLTAEDLPDAFQLFAQVANHDPLVQREAALRFGRPSWCCQVNVGDEAYGVWCVESGCFSCLGAPHAPTLLVRAVPGDIPALLAGEAQRIHYAGPRHEALALRHVFERFLSRFVAPRAAPAPASKLTLGALSGEDTRFLSQSDELVSFAPPFDSLEALLESDVGAALLPPDPALVQRCANAGKHVLCARPAGTPQAWQKITNACERHNVKLMAADLPRFLPAHNYMRKIVRAGLIGEVRTVRALAGGVIPFAALEFILGCACVDITAVGSPDDGIAAIARFENGALASIATASTAQTECSMEIYGTAGVVLENHGRAKPVRFFSGDPRMAEDLETWVEPSVLHDSQDWQSIAARETLASFARCVLEDSAPDLTPAQSARAIACTAAMDHSIEEGRAVAVTEMAPGPQIARRIQPLPREFWEGYELRFRYETAHYFDTELVGCEDGLGVAFTKRPFEEPVAKSFSDKLYQPYWDGGAQAFGILEEDALVACVEVWKEAWSNRMRVTQLWVAEEYHRQGYGGALMDFAKARALAEGCRALIVETQSCNEAAIAFYQAQGLGLFGFDRSCYSNQDIENREVRLELGLYF